MALRIRIEHGQDAGKTIRLGEPGVYRFGRSPQSSAQILDMKVSKDHFEIHVSPSGASLRDLGSSHGTLLNAQIVPQGGRPLSAGDEIRVGLTVIRTLSDGPADVEPKPVAPLPTAGAATNGGVGNGAAKPATGAVGKPVAKALPPDALVGTTLSGYRLLEKVGAGGMGSVYRAEQLSLHREVAIKVLAEKLVSDSAFVDQFQNEARAAGQLNHPNVVQVYDVGEADGRHFFSMEFIHGGSVEGKIPKTGGGVPWQDALNWFLDAANALIFAEQKGILHRDIKPDNFMVGQEGSVKLCDLGLAKKSESADLLAQGIIGTPHFIAPESIRRKTDVDSRADLYSLGCTFYRVLTGKNPYPGTSVKEILLAHLNAPVPRVAAVATDVPKDLDDIIAKLMAKDPAARFQNADDLWEALDKVRLQYGLEAHGLHPGRTKKIAIAIAVVAVAAIGTAIYFVMQPEKTKTVVTTTTVDNTDPLAAKREKEAKADSAFQTLKSQILEKLGKPDQGDAWKHKSEWDEAIAELRKLAGDEKYKDTPAAKSATDYAKKVEDAWKAYKAKIDKNFEAMKAEDLAFDRDTTQHNAEVKAFLEKKDWAGASAKIVSSLEAVRLAGEKKSDDGTPLVAKEKVDAARKSLEALAKEPLAGLTRECDEFLKAQREQLDAARAPEALLAIDTAVAAWLEAHPAGEMPDELGAKIDETRKAAEELRAQILATKNAGQRDSLLADRAAYFDLLHKLFSPLDDAGQGGGSYAGFRLGDAVTKTKAAAPKSEPYKPLFALRAHDAELVAKLPDFLATKFKEKGWKGAISGRGWSGAPKDFKSDGVVVGDKLHLFADEGPGWFLDLFFDKGAERYPLGADEYEAIGALAEAAGIVESDGAKRFDVALASFAKAATADAGRAARMDARRAFVEEDKAAKALLEESDRAVEGASSALTDAEARLFAALADPKKYEEARKAVLGAEGEWRKAIEVAKKSLSEVLTKHPASTVRALLEPKAPENAAFAHETIPPPAKAPPAPVPTPPAAPTPAPTVPGTAPAVPDPGMEPGMAAPEGPRVDDPGMDGKPK